MQRKMLDAVVGSSQRGKEDHVGDEDRGVTKELKQSSKLGRVGRYTSAIETPTHPSTLKESFGYSASASSKLCVD